MMWLVGTHLLMLMLGAGIGVTLMCLLRTGKHTDEIMLKMHERKKDTKR